MLLPGILPRAKDLFFSGFGSIAAMMAIVYGAVRLLPAGHPYLNPANTGRFGIRHVMAEARRNLDFSWGHADQVILYFALLTGFILLLLQFVLLIAAFTVGGAFAQPTKFSDFFVTKEPEKDIAFMLLDRVFGFGATGEGGTAIFGSGALGKMDSNVHEALHALFLFYNTGILAVAMIVMLYYLMVIVAETAQSGTPFGRRFSKAWAPIRMIVAVGLLTPLLWGMNGAQLLTLYAAKWGSSAATNGWIYFLDHLQDATPAGPRDSMVIYPSSPPLSTLLEFLFVAKTCAYAEYYMYGREIDGYLVYNGKDGLRQKMVFPARQNDLRISTMRYNNPSGSSASAGGGADSMYALDFTNNNDLHVVFGERPGQTGQGGQGASGSGGGAIQGGERVRPICGSFMLPVIDVEQPAALYVQQQYWEDLLPRMWSYIGPSPEHLVLQTIPNAMRKPDLPLPFHAQPESGAGSTTVVPGSSCPFNRNTMEGEARYLQCMLENYITRECNPDEEEDIGGRCAGGGYAAEARKKQVGKDSIWEEDFRKYGWAGAAIWYNKIAEMNGAFMSSVQNLPRPILYPEVMEYVAEQKKTGDANANPSERFRPYRANGDRIDFIHPADAYFASLYYQAQSFWQGSYHESRGTSVNDVIVSIFGLSGLFDMRKNEQVHPLAQLVGVGKGLIDSTLLNLGFVVGGGVLGGLGQIFGLASVTTIGNTAMGFGMSIAKIGLALGFVLYYYIPFMPFMYFFFAVGGWVKAIFEAMVGLPLWAIAHLRIDGDGLPGPKAMGGYYLIFEIFLRPILIVFGLIAGITIFAAQAQILNEVWDLVSDNLTGHSGVGGDVDEARGAEKTGSTIGLDSLVATARSVIDQFFYTILYAIVVYMMGLSSFKLVDQMPKLFDRWLGSNASPLDEQGDAPAQTVNQMYITSNIVINDSMGALGALAMRS